MLKDIEQYLQLKGSNLWFGVVQGGDGSLEGVKGSHLHHIFLDMPVIIDFENLVSPNNKICSRNLFNINFVSPNEILSVKSFGLTLFDITAILHVSTGYDITYRRLVTCLNSDEKITASIRNLHDLSTKPMVRWLLRRLVSAFHWSKADVCCTVCCKDSYSPVPKF